MKSLACSFVWWPGLDQEKVKKCNICQRSRHQPAKAPMHQWELPEHPWSRLHADYAGPFMGYMFLIVVDAFTKWLEVKPVKSATTTDQLRSIFATHGLPEMLVTDNGTVFTSMEFQQFMKRNGIRHVKTAPYHPASNGLAERAVQAFKEHMKKSSNDSIETRVARFLFSYRRTPHSTTGIAPAELLLGRLPRSHLDLVKPNLQKKFRSKQFFQTKYHDNQAQERHFEVGDKVFILDLPAKKQWMPGTIKFCALNGQVAELVDGKLLDVISITSVFVHQWKLPLRMT